MDKAEADRHDKMLELAEMLSEVLQKAVPSLNEQQVEEVGIYMAKNRDVFAKAFKSQPDALSELINAPAEPVAEEVESVESDEAPVKPAKAAKAAK
jgi:dsDNA-binding SOS-regulon protein